MPLSDAALRVLGALLEKERTTPDAYPLSTQALLSACNQKTARDPVLNLHLREVVEGLQQLRDRGLAETIRSSGDRVPKHRQRFSDAARLGPREAAVMAVLLLRGPQTPGELRTRTERYLRFGSVSEVGETLDRLASRSPAMVANRGRSPGQQQDRWAHTLGHDATALRPRVRAAPPSHTDDTRTDTPTIEGLLRRIEALEERVAALERSIPRRES